MAALIRFLIGLFIVLFGECIDAFRKTIFKYHGSEPKWYVWFFIMKGKLSYWINWVYYIIGTIVCAPMWLVICIVRFIWDAFVWILRLPFRRRQNAAIA